VNKSILIFLSSLYLCAAVAEGTVAAVVIMLLINIYVVCFFLHHHHHHHHRYCRFVSVAIICCTVEICVLILLLFFAIVIFSIFISFPHIPTHPCLSQPSRAVLATSLISRVDVALRCTAHNRISQPYTSCTGVLLSVAQSISQCSTL